MKLKHILRRGEIYYFRRVVPSSHRSLLGKREVLISLKTRAVSEALLLSAPLIDKYDRLFRGDASSELALEAQDRVHIASRRIGIEYKPLDVRRDAPLENNLAEIAPRVAAFASFQKLPLAELQAIAGDIPFRLPLSQALERYQELSRDKWLNLSQRERDKKWRPFEAAVNDFLQFYPNADALSIGRKDAYRYRAHLIDEIVADCIKADTANKKLMRLRMILEKVFEVDYHENQNPFRGVRIKDDAGKRARPPFSEVEIDAIQKLLSTSSANDQLKAIIKIGMFTGATCKEICLLEEDDIVLDGDIPHIKIQPNDQRHKVKSGGARHREIPLVGEALEAMRQFPGGFPRYRRDNGGEVVSAAANKLIAVVTDKTFYSFRHRIADLLRNSGAQDSLKDAIMGHTTKGMGMHYGAGFTLEKKREALETAFRSIESGL
jgi:integrase